MKNLKTKLLTFLLFLTVSLTQAQELTQTVRGRVVDKDAQITLIGATIIRIGDDISNGVITDINGDFIMKNVPVGRHDFKISYVGYESFILNEIVVSTGKETVLNIELTESVTKIDAVVVKANTRKDKPLNDMATVSSRVFSVEEANRFAGGLDDPMRLASAYAGVSAPGIESNGISVRGNSPTLVQYRMEGVEIENANHFEGGDVLGGGFVSLFSSQVLGNSDFMTGAFPAQYGNALSGTFDMKMRTGNTQNYEHAVQVGVLGIDVASEGPLKKGSNASYLFNYRYSTFGLMEAFLPEGEGMPIYQDLNFKIHLPTKKAGVFSLWGTGGIDNFDMKAKEDSSEWNMEAKREEIDSDFAPLMLGATHKYVLKNSAYINSSVLYSTNSRNESISWMNDDLELNQFGKMKNNSTSITASTFINKKFSPRHTNRTGITYKYMNFDYDEWGSENRNNPGELEQTSHAEGTSALIQTYTQSKISLSNKLVLNAGLHYQILQLNNKSSIEPRVGIRYTATPRFTISGAYGKHSRTQVLNHYFVTNTNSDVTAYPNKDLDFTKAHHFVLGFDYNINPNTRVKIEPYYQILSDIPVIEDSSFAVINLENGHGFKEELVNEGTGRNVGVELTLERFLDKGYYYLLTASVYDSKYTGGDGVERNTLHNSNYVANILGGKEWTLGKNKSSTLGINARYYLIGGRRQSPVDYTQSHIQQEVVYDNTHLYEEQAPATSRLDLTLSFKRNRPKYTSTLSLQLLNTLGSVITYNQEYDFTQNQVVEMQGTSNLPNISWKIEF